MPTTPVFQIPYPDGNSNYTPLQDWFAGIANGVENALTNGLGGAPRTASSDSARNAIYPSPVQGNTVVRPDKGYTEQYFGLYNSSTNPSGATPAGWYPMTGTVMTSLRGSANQAIGNADAAVTLWNITDTIYPGMWSAGTPQRITLPFIGMWEVDSNFTTVSGSAALLRTALYLNGTVLTHSQNNAPGSSGVTDPFARTSAIVPATATTDYIEVRASSSAASGVSIYGPGSNLRAKFLGPRRA